MDFVACFTIFSVFIVFRGLPVHAWTCSGDSCYQVVTGSQTWDDARSNCHSRGGDLVSIRNLGEQKIVEGLLSGHEGERFWIGLKRHSPVDVWFWSDGIKSSYRYWEKGEPNNIYNSNENCGEIRKSHNYEWNDSGCGQKYNFICKAACTNTIAKCHTVTCSNSPSNKTCTKCTDKYFYKPYNRYGGSTCADKCSWNYSWCWPGSCGNEYAHSCICESGFTTIGSTCQLDSNHHEPEILDCRIKVFSARGDARPERGGSSKCSEQADFYGNFQVDHVTSDATFEFSVSLTSNRVGWVESEEFGITDASVIIQKKNLQDNVTLHNETILKSDPYSQHPKEFFSQSSNISNTWSLNDGESLCIRFLGKAGGYLVSKNIPTRVTTNVPYNKVQAFRDICYIYDNQSPIHCLEKNTCTGEPLLLSSRTIRDILLNVEFKNWFDPIPHGGNNKHKSGIETYEISVFEVKDVNSTHIGVDTTPIVNPVTVMSNVTELQVTLPIVDHPVLYAVQLEVKDVANNVHQARRFVLFDNTSRIAINNVKPFRVTSADSKTRYTWQTNHGQMCYSWTDRFYNTEYIRNNLLRPIIPDHHGFIKGIYEQNTGLLPVNGTVNVHGITSFTYTLSKGNAIMQQNQAVNSFTSQSLCVSPHISDGETFWLNLKSTDIMNKQLEDKIFVHIDASVAEIENIWLVKDGYKRLYVHNSVDLSKMVLQFEAFDPHSGLHSVEWGIGTTGGGIELGHGALGVIKINESCLSSDTCYCPLVGPCEYFNYTLSLNSLVSNDTHMGNHNRQYFFTIKVTNKAQLVSTEHIDVLVDDSPPSSGVVQEGPIDGPDIDYTSDNQVIAHWHGFIDHESGIKLYKVGFSAICLNLTNLENAEQNSSDIVSLETTETSTVIPLSAPGKYFVTVVAYNNAMEPSKPVCSDGIVNDQTPPIVGNVTLTNARVAERVACSHGIAWFIHENVTRVKLRDTEACRKRCNASSFDPFISALPQEFISTYDDEVSDFMCERLQQYNDTLIYLPVDKIELKWKIADDLSQVQDLKVGFGTTKGSKVLPNIVGYQNSKHKTLYRDRHSALSSGTEMYIFIKARNKAGLETIISYGPVLIDETPPTCPASLHANVNGSEVILKWNESTFYDLEQREQIGSIYFRIGHEHGHVTPYLQWKINESPKCLNENYECIAYPMSRLQDSDTELGLSFTFDLHVYNYAGHYCSVKSIPFTLPSKFPPGHGIVLDIDPESVDDSDEYKDTDFSFSFNAFCVSWRGFWHHQNVLYKIGVGKSRDTDDVVSFHSVNAKNIYCKNTTQIVPFVRYFVTVLASCSGGMTSTSSDGFIVIESSAVLNTAFIADGEGCSEYSLITDMAVNSTMKKGKTTNLTIDLQVGNHYMIKVSPTNINISIESEDIFNNFSKSDNSYIIGMAMKSRISMRMCNNGEDAHVEKVQIVSCEDDIDFQASTEIVTAHWSLGKKYENYISHYLFGVSFECMHSNECSSLKTENVGKKSYGILNNLNLSPGFYMTFIQACFGAKCLQPVYSDGFLVENRVPQPNRVYAALENIHATCSEFTVSWEEFSCSKIDLSTIPVFYRWALFKDVSENTALAPWSEPIFFRNNFKQETACIKLPTYEHADVYVHLQGFCKSGQSVTKSVKATIKPDPNLFSKTQLYEVDSKADYVNKLKDSLNSSNIGAMLRVLHNHELDFITSDTVLAGIIPRIANRTIKWYLTTSPTVPIAIYESTDECIASIKMISETAFAVFKGVNLDHDNIYYICARINRTEVHGDFFIEVLDEINVCSNGVLVDDTEPAPGTVKVLSRNGFITDGSSMTVEWKGFRESHKYIQLGYTSGIRNYMYCVGSYPLGQDVLPYTDAKLETSITQRNLSLATGTTYFVTVKAFNQVGKFTYSLSNGVVFDNTPPEVGMIHVGNVHFHKYFVSSRNFMVHWMGFKDLESGISDFKVGIGSTTHSSDVVPLRTVEGEYAVFRKEELALLHDGHQYFVNIMVTNRAGLTSFMSSDLFMIDSTHPLQGAVRDGPPDSQSDLDYQSEVTTLKCHWTDFIDQHSKIAYYNVGLGTIPGELDVFPYHSVGLRKEMIWRSNFVPGQRYYVTVEACNHANLCTTSSSNGIIVDNSPPISGLVHVGVTGEHTMFISHTATLQAQWIGFEDPQSDIHHFEACIGTSPNKCEIHPLTNFLLSSSMTLNQLNMPIGKHLYVTVIAFNNVGLGVNKTSDNFRIDITPPVIIKPPRFIATGSTINKTQWDVSLMKLEWKFEENESSIIKQTVTLFTHHEGHTAVENVDAISEEHLTINLDPKEWLRGGDKYTARITACNSASLCSSAYSDAILVDSTPPHLGGFKNSLTWSLGTNYSVHLKWYGFDDTESGINRYYLTVSKTYSGSELSSGVILCKHRGSRYADQEAGIELSEPLSVGQKIFLSIWTENKAGLISAIAKIKTEVVATENHQHSGLLMIEKHSCDVEYCNKDCTCAVIGRKCNDVAINDTCNEVDNPLSHPIVVTISFENKNVTSSSACLSAHWVPESNVNSTNILRYESSFGVKDMDIGVGIFDQLRENIWYDIGRSTSIVHCLPIGKQLEHDDSYVAYVRAWTSTTTYHTFNSQPLKIDLTPPALKRGGFIMDSDISCIEDTDYTSITDSITACWKGVFSDQQSNIEAYHAYLGTTPGGDDTVAVQYVGLQTSITWTNLALHQGTKYYITVQATNGVDLHTVASSDGFTVDNKTPTAGTVFNTRFHKNIQVQSTRDTFDVSWHGFQDSESHIKSYKVVIISDKEIEKYNIRFIDVGIRNSVHLKDLNLMHGQRYRAAVRAVDAAGYESPASYSDALLIDTTAPTSYTCTRFNNSIIESLTSVKNSMITWNDTISLQASTAYRLKLEIHNVDPDVMATLDVGKLSVALTLSRSSDGTFKTEYNFIHLSDGEIPIYVSVHSAQQNAMVNLELAECIDMSYDTQISNALEVRQISPNLISVCVNVLDEESGIKHILIGAGTTDKGFQIKPLELFSLANHVTLEVELMHATPVYITAVVENHAGLKTSYSSDKLLMDHTGPLVYNVTSNVSYNTTEENTTITITVSWTAIDDESGIKFCMCALGSSRGFTNILPWTESIATGYYSSEPLILSHGTRIYTMVKCVNFVELPTNVDIGPLTIIYSAPDVSDGKIRFLRDNHDCNSDENIQSNATTMHLLWSDIRDLADISYYECRIRHGEHTEVDWKNVSLRSAVSWKNLQLKDGLSYTFDLRATNKGRITSAMINASVVIESQTPGITGHERNFMDKLVKDKQLDLVDLTEPLGNLLTALAESEGKVSIDWKNVFTIEEPLFKLYIISIGTKEGHSDLVQHATTLSTHYSTDINPGTSEIYVALTAMYCTGKEATVRQMVYII